jgi:hypothetical protein
VVIESLQRVTHIGVLVDPPILLGQVGINGVNRLLDEGLGLAKGGMLLAVEDEGLGGLGMAVFDQDLFGQILDVLDGGDAAILVDDLENPHHLPGNGGGLPHVAAADGPHRLLDGGGNFTLFKRRQAPVSFANKLQHPSLRAAQHDMKRNLTPLQAAASREKHKILAQQKLVSTTCCVPIGGKVVDGFGRTHLKGKDS